MTEKTLTPDELDDLEAMAARVESGAMGPALYGTLLPGVFPALVAMARRAQRWTRAEDVTACEVFEASHGTEPIVGRAESVPPVKGRVGFYVECIVPAEDLAAFRGKRTTALATHVDDMAHEMIVSLKEEQVAARPYRIRISIEPEPR